MKLKSYKIDVTYNRLDQCGQKRKIICQECTNCFQFPRFSVRAMFYVQYAGNEMPQLLKRI